MPNTKYPNHPNLVLVSSEARFEGMKLGWIDHLEGEVPWVDFKGNPGAPVSVIGSVVGIKALRAAAFSRRQAILMFDGDSPQPILLGLVQPGVAMSPPPQPLTGQRVIITAEEHLELRSGSARIVFDSLGTIHVEGECIETRAMSINRLQGDEIEIN